MHPLSRVARIKSVNYSPYNPAALPLDDLVVLSACALYLVIALVVGAALVALNRAPDHD